LELNKKRAEEEALRGLAAEPAQGSSLKQARQKRKSGNGDRPLLK
jgi:hypothetical protein